MSILEDCNPSILTVVDGLSTVHPSETALLNNICQLSTNFIKFTSFITHYGHSPAPVSEVDDMYGFYLQSFAHGLDLLLTPYRSALVSLEKELLADPHLTLIHLQTALEEYQLLFPALAALLEDIQAHQIHGALILEKLHKASASGITSVKHAMRRLQHSCHTVMYRQLSLWLLHGVIQDKYSEFFIHKTSLNTEQSPSTEDLEGTSTDTSISLERFSIRLEMLPSYLPGRVADKILFVGESVQMFRLGKPEKNTQKRSVMQNVEVKFAKELEDLSERSVFDLAEFEGVIDDIRIHVAEKLWRLIVEESDLIAQLNIMKDFFLLGRGELFLAFIDCAQFLLCGIPSSTTEHDVNVAFQQATRNVLLDDDQLLRRFKLKVPLAKGSSDGTETGWNCLQMTCSVQWPLHVLFTPSVLHRYNMLFQFLLHVKRVQQSLLGFWIRQMRLGSSGSLWWLRNHMAFLINNLQYYLQVDVIESQFSILCDKINSVHDFEAIRLAHDHFMTSLLGHTFILMKPIHHCLMEILNLCSAYTQLMEQMDDGADHSQQLNDIQKTFQRQSCLLFSMLTGFRSQQSTPHLAQLLLRIDFNKVFSSSVGTLNT